MHPCLGQHFKWDAIIVFIILFWATLVGYTQGATGYRCFTCVSQNNDNTCLNDPTKVTSGSVSVPCDQENGEFGWCMIYRQELTSIPGEIVSFARMCLKTQPTFLDDVVTDSEFTIYYRTCRTHLCNSGDGLASFGSGGGGSGGSGGSGLIIVVPSESGSPAMTSISLALFSVTGLFTLTRIIFSS